MVHSGLIGSAGAIGGLVKDTQDAYLEGVLVRINGTGMEALTDATGEYVFKDVADGQYRLEFSKNDYQSI